MVEGFAGPIAPGQAANGLGRGWRRHPGHRPGRLSIGRRGALDRAPAGAGPVTLMRERVVVGHDRGGLRGGHPRPRLPQGPWHRGRAARGLRQPAGASRRLRRAVRHSGGDVFGWGRAGRSGDRRDRYLRPELSARRAGHRRRQPRQARHRREALDGRVWRGRGARRERQPGGDAALGRRLRRGDDRGRPRQRGAAALRRELDLRPGHPEGAAA